MKTGTRWPALTSLCAVALWVWAVTILADSENLAPIYNWEGWLRISWQFIKITVLVYSGLALITGKQDREHLERSNARLEEIIGDLQSDRQPE